MQILKISIYFNQLFKSQFHKSKKYYFNTTASIPNTVVSTDTTNNEDNTSTSTTSAPLPTTITTTKKATGKKMALPDKKDITIDLIYPELLKTYSI